MPTTIHSRVAALGIAAVAGFAALGMSAGPASASPEAQSAAGTVQAPQSSGYPAAASDYADELVQAWGNGDDIDVGELAAPSVVDGLADHGDEHATHWARIAADGDSIWTDVVYENSVSHEVMALTVANKTAEVDEEQAVQDISFHG
ncbi:hypothetical protein [Brevibacterium spongiae]|uniref:Uncharacterized protein n=1 Tax=Brevibacterium spongiae TaxID=2909672 RepID=A0ABY5ST22_9MICO|nr:hypothetical protein [Brevibacterium spongiae]UVI37349.1 hypothetical protein L1F31_06795 [Brevibacterium spongiae]